MSLRILLIEDNRADVLFTRRALRKTGLDTTLAHARDGREALEHLASTESLPQLILLDLNMPIMGGKEFLSHMGQEPRWASIEVVVLSTSDAPKDIAASRELGAQHFMVKPIDVERLGTILREFVPDDRPPQH